MEDRHAASTAACTSPLVSTMRNSGGRGAQDLLCFGGVVHARQLDDDAILALLLMTGSATPNSLLRVALRSAGAA